MGMKVSRRGRGSKRRAGWWKDAGTGRESFYDWGCNKFQEVSVKRRITSTKRFREQSRKKKQEDKEQRRAERAARGASPEGSELNEALVELDEAERRREAERKKTESREASGPAGGEGSPGATGDGEPPPEGDGRP